MPVCRIHNDHIIICFIHFAAGDQIMRQSIIQSVSDDVQLNDNL